MMKSSFDEQQARLRQQQQEAERRAAEARNRAFMDDVAGVPQRLDGQTAAYQLGQLASGRKET